MSQMITRHGLQVAAELDRFIEDEALPGSGVDSAAFWQGFAALLHDLAPKNRALLAERDRLQLELDTWHRANPGPVTDLAAYQAFLAGIGYLVAQPGEVKASTSNVDREIAEQAGPQLVVPVTNQRYALNAANARWGSLYDALYGTDAIAEADGAEKGSAFNPVRGQRVIARARAFLDQAAPLAQGSHVDATGYSVQDGQLRVTLKTGSCGLQQPAQFRGYQGASHAPSALLLRNHGLHFEIQIDAHHSIGKTDAAHVKDILMEAAVSTIADCEDSVAAVDAEDKVLVYRNWLGLMKGDLVEQVSKGGKTFERSLNPDREYTAGDGSNFSVPGRSLLFIRNVGHLMTNPAILDRDGNEIPEGILDAVVTTLAAVHDLQRKMNSRTGSIYIVKPKMHGPAEVAFAGEVFGRVEDLLKLPQVTVHVHNAHRNTDESYTGPLLADVLARAGLSPAHENEAMILHSSIVATGTDHYFVLYSVAEVEPTFSTGQVIVAVMKSGLPDTEGGIIQLINTADAKPARWLHSLADLNVMSVTPGK